MRLIRKKKTPKVEACKTGAVALLTYYKSGSQWVRDLLSHRLAAEANGFEGLGQSADVSDGCWPELTPRRVIGPVYNANRSGWLNSRSAFDKAIVVVRDPRDAIVSRYYSMAFSHSRNHATEERRAHLLGTSHENQLLFAICEAAGSCITMQSWTSTDYGEEETLFFTSYERLTANTEAELSAIYAFLGWDVPAKDLSEIVAELSFETRSGRDRGQENQFSHYRKGVPGDWRSHFSRMTGQALECVAPNLVHTLGYDDPMWHESLPVSQERGFSGEGAVELKQLVELQAEVVRLEEKIRYLTHDPVGG